MDEKNSSSESLFALAWDVEGYRQLLEMVDKYSSAANAILSYVVSPQTVHSNVPKQLADLREELLPYLKNLFLKHCDVASHLLIFMISDEKRNMKPYAIPVRAMPFRSITDAKVRELRDELRDALTSRGLVVVGFVTDGEWNSIRTQGSTRPVSVIQLMANARKEARKVSIKKIKEYFSLSASKKPMKNTS